MRQTAAFFAVASIVALAGTEAMARDVQLSGMGIRKCSEWLQWKEAKNGEARAMALEWTQGFIAGHNIFARKGGAPANSVVASSTVLIPLLDSYCQKSPDQRIFTGVVEITRSLGGAGVNMAPKPPAPQAPQPDTSKERES